MSNTDKIQPATQTMTRNERVLPPAEVAVRAEHEALLAHAKARAAMQARMDGLSTVSPNGSKGRRAKAATGKASPAVWSEGARDLAPQGGLAALEQGSTAEPNRSVKSSAATGQDSPGSYLAGGVFPVAGLALSGGGIRSAAFCTGATQALEQNKVFAHFDYLSTVSGGGYIGSTITLNAANGKGFALLKGGDEKKDAEALKSVRNNTNFLHLDNIAGVLKSLAIYLRGLTVNVIIMAAVVFALAAITLLSNATYEDLGKPDIFGLPVPGWWAALGAMAVTLGLMMAYVVFNTGWANALAWWPSKSAGIAGKILWVPAALIAAICITAFLEAQPLVISKMFVRAPAATGIVMSCPSNELQAQCTAPDGSTMPAGSSCPQDRLSYGCKIAEATAADGKPEPHYFSDMFGSLIAWFKGLLAPLLAVFGFAASALGNVVKDEDVQNTWSSLLKRNLRKLLIWAAALTFLLGLWLIYLMLVYWAVDISGAPDVKRDLPVMVGWLFGVWKALSGGWPVGVLYVLLAVGLYLLQANLQPNTNSLHRLYRDRLGNAFCFIQNDDGPSDASGTKLSSLAGARPIPIINAAVNLQNSPVVKSKGRKADFFSITPFSIGSDATGYAATRLFEEHVGGDLDIATAIAISGAAASSNMGSQSMRPLSPLLAFLNIRLGYWLPNPKRLISESKLKPNLWYFANEALGLLNENRDTVYLTDGGHIENLGIYELLRRRCRLIVAVDAEADPKMGFGSFVALQRYARIDLGVRIDLPWKELAAVTLGAMSGTAPPRHGPHCAVGKIEYDNGGTGILVYVKSTVTGDENDYIRDYNKRNADFPHQSTGDQFFSEEQFEVYRALGFHAVNGMLSGDHDIATEKGLQRLTDEQSPSETAKAAAHLLGVQRKRYPQEKQKPPVHLVRLLK